MTLFEFLHSHKPERFSIRGGHGVRPGTLIIDQNAMKPTITVIAYKKDEFVEETVDEPKQLSTYLENWPVTWVNVVGLGDEKIIRDIAELFKLHRLAIEDIVNVPQRPKVDPYDEHLYIVTRLLAYTAELDAEQVSVFVGRNYVLSIQEKPGDCFDPVRERIRDGRGRIRHVGPDYLAYALLDAVIDMYFGVLEHYGEMLDNIQDEIINDPRNDLIHDIHRIKRELQAVRRGIWPTREMIHSLLHDEEEMFTKETRMYLRDCSDHVSQAMDLLENYREVASGLMDVYLNSISNRMNQVMKVLTIIATIFIPLSFVAGLYGMNFGNMPELDWRFGYPFALSIMAAMTVTMLLIFKRKGWF